MLRAKPLGAAPLIKLADRVEHARPSPRGQPMVVADISGEVRRALALAQVRVYPAPDEAGAELVSSKVVHCHQLYPHYCSTARNMSILFTVGQNSTPATASETISTLPPQSRRQLLPARGIEIRGAPRVCRAVVGVHGHNRAGGLFQDLLLGSAGGSEGCLLAEGPLPAPVVRRRVK